MGSWQCVNASASENTPSWIWRFSTPLQKEFVLFSLFYIADNFLSRIWPSRHVGTLLLERFHHEVIMPVEVRIMKLEVALDFSPFAELVSLKFVLALLVRKEICRGNVSIVGGMGLAQRWYMEFCKSRETILENKFL